MLLTTKQPFVLIFSESSIFEESRIPKNRILNVNLTWQ